MQPPDVGEHALFQKLFDTKMLLEKKRIFAEKHRVGQNKPTLTANEWRELVVRVGCEVYYDLIAEEEVQSSWARAGFSDKPECTNILLPSGVKVFPHTMQVGHTQEGCGLKIMDAGTERIDVPAASPQQAMSPQTTRALRVVHEEGDSKLVFPTEREKANTQRKQKLACAKREKPAEDKLAAEEQSETESESESESQSDEETKPFDCEAFLLQAQAHLRWSGGVTVQHSAPAAIENLQAGQGIAFHFADGWDAGVIKRTVDPEKHSERYNVDVLYPAKGGTVFHCLHLELYGTGDDEGAPLGSWVLLAPAIAPTAVPRSKRKASRSPSLTRSKTRSKSRAPSL